MEELIDVLDEFGNKTGIVKKKSDIKRDGDYHRAIAVLILNNSNEILMQQRKKDKKVYPGLWSIFVKGHVQAGENSLDACIREVKEEVGIDIEGNELEYLYTINENKEDNNYIERIFFDTYVLRKNVNEKDINIQVEELEEAKFVSSKNVLKLINKNDPALVPNFKDYIFIKELLKKLSN